MAPPASTADQPTLLPATEGPRIELHNGDCLEVMPTLPAGSVQMVSADVPYSNFSRRQTANAWDVPINLADMAHQMKQVSTDNAVWAFTATQPFTSDLVTTWRSRFRYEIIYEKNNASGFLQAKRQPMRAHESVLIFYAGRPTYVPQMTEAKNGWSGGKSGTKATNWTGFVRTESRGGLLRYPRSVFRCKAEPHNQRVHPTQKPVALIEWLIRTYTNEGDTVLDPVFGSGTTAIACLRTGRNFVGIEKDPTYFEVARKRIADEQARLGFRVTV